MYVLIGFTKNGMVSKIYAQVSAFACVNFFSLIVEVKEISGNCADVFGKNGKYTLYLDIHCYSRNKVEQIFECLRRTDFRQVLQNSFYGNRFYSLHGKKP